MLLAWAQGFNACMIYCYWNGRKGLMLAWFIAAGMAQGVNACMIHCCWHGRKVLMLAWFIAAGRVQGINVCMVHCYMAETHRAYACRWQECQGCRSSAPHISVLTSPSHPHCWFVALYTRMKSTCERLTGRRCWSTAQSMSNMQRGFFLPSMVFG